MTIKAKQTRTEDKLIEIINRGGKTTEESFLNEDDDMRLTIRISKDMLDKLDRDRKNKPGKFNRNLWITEAIQEKLNKDMQK